jgi:hypothetical protein
MLLVFWVVMLYNEGGLKMEAVRFSEMFIATCKNFRFHILEKRPLTVCVCVCVCVCARARARVRKCVCMCVRAASLLCGETQNIAFAFIPVTGESSLPCADVIFSGNPVPSVSQKLSPVHKDVYFPADSPPPSPLPLPHYLSNNTLPHRRHYVGSEDPTSLGMNYSDETGSNVYMNGSSALYGCSLYTHVNSGSQKLELHQVGRRKDDIIVSKKPWVSYFQTNLTEQPFWFLKFQWSSKPLLLLMPYLMGHESWKNTYKNQEMREDKKYFSIVKIKNNVSRVITVGIIHKLTKL